MSSPHGLLVLDSADMNYHCDPYKTAKFGCLSIIARIILMILVLFLCAHCAPYVVATKGGGLIASGGFASKVGKGRIVASNATTKVDISFDTYNGTEVLNTLIPVAGTAYAVGAKFGADKVASATAAKTQQTSIIQAGKTNRALIGASTKPAQILPADGSTVVPPPKALLAPLQ